MKPHTFNGTPSRDLASLGINVYCVHSMSHVVREVHIGMVVQKKLNDISMSAMCSPPKWRVSCLYHVNKRVLERDNTVL